MTEEDYAKEFDDIPIAPCPFCGAKDLVMMRKPTHDGYEKFYVYCPICMATGPKALTPPDCRLKETAVSAAGAWSLAVKRKT